MSKVKRRSYIEIKRDVDRKLGNKMTLDRIQHGEYKLTTGENTPGHANEMYADKVEDEIKEMVEQINSDEDLEFSKSDIRTKSKDFKRQLKEGRKEIQINIKDRDADKKVDEDEEEEKKRGFFF